MVVEEQVGLVTNFFYERIGPYVCGADLVYQSRVAPLGHVTLSTATHPQRQGKQTGDDIGTRQPAQIRVRRSLEIKTLQDVQCGRELHVHASLP